MPLFFWGALLLCASTVHALPQKLGDLDSDGQITVLDLVLLINHVQSNAGLPPAGGTGRLPVPLLGYADVNGDGVIDRLDVDLLADAVLGLPILTQPRPLVAEPAPGSSEVGVTVRPRVYFPKRIIPATLNSGNFYASFAGQKIPARIVPAQDGSFAWLFFDTNMPSASQIQLTVDGSTISVISGEILDADADLAPGGVFHATFSTVNVVPVPNTSIIGQIVDPGPDMRPRTSDDVTLGAGGFTYLHPIPGVKVFLHGMEDQPVFTDSNGWFRLSPVPVGDVKVVTDGLTATAAHPGFYWPEMVLDVHVDPGITNYTMFIRDANGDVVRDTNGLRTPVATMYLPRVMSNVLQTVSLTDTTHVTLSSNAAYDLPPAQQVYLTVDVTPNSLIGMDGQPLAAGQVGVTVVPPSLVADMLPPGLAQHTFDITVQAPGVSTFTTPAPMTFPNVFNAPPGTKLNFLSFDHTTGRLVIEGTATVSDDGLYVRTDPGSGVTHPGWHGLMPPGSQSDGPQKQCQSFTLADGVALLGSAGDCAGNLLPSYKLLFNFAGAFADGANLGRQVRQLAEDYAQGKVSKEDVLGTLEGLLSVKNRLADTVKELTKEGDPVGKTIAIAKCVQGFAETSTGLICNRKECLSSFGNTVCDKILPLEQFASKLLDKAKELEQGIRNAPLDLLCLSFQGLLTTVRGAGDPGQLALAAAGPDPNIVAAMTNFLALMDAFNLQAGPAQDILALEADNMNIFTNMDNSGVAPLALSVGAIPGAFWRAAVGGTELHGQTAADGQLNLPFIPSDAPYLFQFFDPVHNLILTSSGISSPSGVPTVLSNFTFTLLVDAPDSDHDGLADAAELVVGTDPHKFSTTGDGLSDGAKVSQGLDPLSGAGFATGVIAILPLPGEAKEIVLEGSILDAQQQTAYVALGSRGLGIINASKFRMPILIGQLDLPGDATDVAVDSGLELAVVAGNAGGLHFLSVADRARPTLLQTINVNASRVEIVEGLVYVTSGSQLLAYDLINHERSQILSLPGGNLTDLVVDGSFLYTMDSNRALRVVDIHGSNMLARGSLTLAAAAGRIFVGNGIAYVAGANGITGGFLTVNVSNPDSPTLISGADAVTIEGDALAANGSGLAVSVGYVRGPQGQPLTALDVVNVSDPANTAGFITRYPLPVKPFSVAIGAGIAFVADGKAGLQVVNYLAFDNRGVAPTAILSGLPPDLDPNTPGLQVLEGSFLHVDAQVSDDVQVRNVELLFNGVSVRNDVSFPFDLGGVLPVLSVGLTNVEVRVRATDTGGNVGLSAPLLLQLVPDTFPPTLVSINPTNGAIRGKSFHSVTARFSEPLDPNSIVAGSVTLVGPGGVVPAQGIQLLNNDTAVQLTYPALATGIHHVVISGPLIRDRAGNALGAGNLTSTFEIREATSVWLSSNGGYWDDPANWGGVVPGANDDVLINTPDLVTITNRVGTNYVRSMRTGNSFFMAGGMLIVDDTFAVGGTFTINAGTFRGGTIVAGGGVVIRAGTLDSVTLDGDLDVGYTISGAQLLVLNGLVLNGTARIGNRINNWYGLVSFQDSQTLSGVGDVIFGGQNQSLAGFNALRLTVGDSTLTLGAGINIHGDNGSLGYSPIWGGPPNVGLINQGTIRADSAGGTIALRGQSFSNRGLLQSPAGTVDLAGTFLSSGLGAFQSTGGRVQLSGALNNTNATLRLDGPDKILTMAGGSLHGGILVVTNGGSLAFGTGTLDGVTINGPVDVASGGTLNLAGNWLNRGVLNLSNATLNLAGNFTVASLGRLNRSGGGELDLTGTLSNTNTTLLLDGTNATWTLAGGTILGGTVATTNGARLACDFNPSHLDGVTINGDLDVGNAVNSGQLIILNGLVLNGTARVGNPSNSWYGVIGFQGSQTLSGNGDVIFGGLNLAGYNALRLTVPATALTLGPGITVHGRSGTVGYSQIWGGSINSVVTNRGSIRADDAAGTIIVRGLPFYNAGVLQSPAGTIDLAGSEITAGLGAFQSGAGRVQLSGVLDNTNATLILSGPDNVLTMAGGTVRSGTLIVTNGAGLIFGTGTLEGVTIGGPVEARSGATLNLTSAWLNRGVITTSNATINLGGTLAVPALGIINRNGGELDLSGVLNNTNNTLLLDGTNGSWTLTGGRILGGTVTAINGARVACNFDGNNRLDGVTFNGPLDVGNDTIGAQLTILNGLVLNGTLRVGNPTNDWYGVVNFQGGQTLGGNGEVIFGGLNLAGYNALRAPAAASTLTVGPGITVHGKNGAIGYAAVWGGAANVGVTNLGTIRADVAGGTVSIRGQSFKNAGLVQSTAGTIDLAGTLVTSGLGTFQSAGGQVQLSGLLDNTNAILVLDGPGNVLTLAGGTIRNGTVIVTNGAGLVFGTGTLEGVNLGGPVDARDGATVNLTGGWVNRGVITTSNATLNLGGAFVTPSLGVIHRMGGSMNLTGTLTNANNTLLLDGTNGSWMLTGGRILGGTVTATNGARLSCSFDANNRLDGVAFNGELGVGLDVSAAQVSITNGLILNGTARVGNPTNDWYGVVNFLGTQTLSGNGEVIFGSQALAGYNAVRETAATNSLTLGPGITVHGKNGTLVYSPTWGGPANVGLTNRGTITADVAAGTINIRAQPFTNLGTTNQLNGGRLVISP